ncbi:MULTISPECIES: hypothetical protein [unclassified Microcoleus]
MSHISLLKRAIAPTLTNLTEGRSPFHSQKAIALKRNILNSIPPFIGF